MTQIETTLPTSAWKDVVIRENDDKMIVPELKTVKLEKGLWDSEEEPCYLVRSTVSSMLLAASENLPDDYRLGLVEGYRNEESQKKKWNNAINFLKNKYPDLTDEKITAKASLVVALPSPLANHNCGGAVDVVLLDYRGALVDMGCAAQSNDPEEARMFSSHINEGQIKNRSILRDAMVKAGFVYYPGEWWHYCYGDRMWAVYSGKKESFYGPVTQKLFE